MQIERAVLRRHEGEERRVGEIEGGRSERYGSCARRVEAVKRQPGNPFYGGEEEVCRGNEKNDPLLGENDQGGGCGVDCVPAFRGAGFASVKTP